jgi:hypothetical protein
MSIPSISRLIPVALACLLVPIAAGCGGAADHTPNAPNAPARLSGPPARLSRPPTPSTAGVPKGWVPASTRTTDLVVTKPGAVVQDVRLRNANLVVDAPNVTIRRVELQGGGIQNRPSGTCRNGLVIEESTIGPAPGQTSSVESEGVVGIGGYTARRVKIWRRGEGFRVGGRSAGCGPVRIEDSFVQIVLSAQHCEEHSDGIQGFDGPPLTVVNTTIDFTEAVCGNAPFFVSDGQGNVSAKIDGLLLIGGGIPFRLGVPGSVAGLKIADRSWSYGPVHVRCELLSAWDAHIVRVTRGYRIASTLRRQRCT